MNTPRIRNDLHATPAEEGGIKYFDVSDPKSGGRMRLYDFEWLIAERMDGRRPFDEVASWAHERLGIHPSASDLEEYARRLRDLGFFDSDAAANVEIEDAPVRSAPTAATMMGEAPRVATASSGNGAGRAAEDEDIPPLVAEGALMGSSQPSGGQPRITGPMATAPTTAMPTLSSERPAVAAGKPHTDTGRMPAHDDEPPRSSMGSIVGIFLVLLVVGGIVAYVKFMGGAAAKVATVVATPREVVRLYDGAAAVKQGEGQTLSFGEAGKVSDVVAAGTEAKAGMPLATLDSYPAVEKALADVKDRASFYEKQLQAAKAKNDAEAVKTAEAKVAEKKKLLGELEARAGKVRLVAPGPATVEKVMIAAGADAKLGEPVVKLTDKRLTAEFKLPAADAAAMKAGQAVSLQPAAGGAPLAGRVIKLGGETATVELDEGTVKVGDNLRLVKARVPNVVQVPAAAVVRRDGAEVVFVFADGEVHQRKVTVVDRTGSEVLVGSGLGSGDQIVSSGAENLHDGQKASQ
jgi:membrane fusion protein (multidrug efflux system)